jgi:hypothetical protein
MENLLTADGRPLLTWFKGKNWIEEATKCAEAIGKHAVQPNDEPDLLYKAYREAATEYSNMSGLYVNRDASASELEEKQLAYELARANWYIWYNSVS